MAPMKRMMMKSSPSGAKFVKTSTGSKAPRPTSAPGVRVGVDGCKSKRAHGNVKASY